jgi:hypothetical protein
VSVPDYEPSEGDRIDNRGVTAIEGTACSNDNIWVFDYPLGAQRYYWNHDHAIDVIGGDWAIQDARIGALSDPVGTKYLLVAVRVGRACDRALRAVPPNKGNVAHFPARPAKCPPLKDATDAQSVVVVKRKR